MFKSLNAIQSAIVEVGITRPKLVLVGALIVTIVLLVALVLRVTVDTDPENMLSSSHPVRVLNNSIAEEFGAKNMLVLGIVDDEGVLNRARWPTPPGWWRTSRRWTVWNPRE